MRSRLEILKDIVQFKNNIYILQKEISQYPWDAEKPLLIITKAIFSSVLQRCIDDDISFFDLEYWANTIESRDDLGFEKDDMQEIIFELANPEVYGIITKERLKQIIYNFSYTD